ncbi:hypothetical protein L1887_13794 [Cichorium endivia]|nr:hypothetical protein L1887_13794 [Cichorium endivia]
MLQHPAVHNTPCGEVISKWEVIREWGNYRLVGKLSTSGEVIREWEVIGDIVGKLLASEELSSNREVIGEWEVIREWGNYRPVGKLSASGEVIRKWESYPRVGSYRRHRGEVIDECEVGW